jgi:hypothetical protein
VLEELRDRLLHVHSHVTWHCIFAEGGTDSKSTRHPTFVKKLFARWNMLQKH